MVDWLSDTVLQKILEAGGGGPITAKLGIVVEAAVPRGNNHASTLYRVKRRTNESVVVKALPTGAMKDIVIELNMFQKESVMYNHILPQMQKLLGSILVPENYTSPFPNTFILEDLNVKNYKMCDRRKQLDLQHSLRVIEVIAKFHACSMVVLEKESEWAAIAKSEPLYTKEAEGGVMHNYVKTAFWSLADEIESWPEVQEQSETLRRFGENAYDRIVDTVCPKEEQLNVLNHGDLWTANIMFQYDEENKITEVKLIDFQSVRYSSPALDLQFFLVTSVREPESVKLKLLSTYLATFNTTLHSLGSSIKLTESQLAEQMASFECFGLLTSATHLAMFTEEEFDLNEAKQTPKYDNPIAETHKGRSYRQIMPHFVKYYHAIGLIT